MIRTEQLLPFWEQLSEQQRQLFTAGSSRRRVTAGQLVHQGDQDCVGLIFVLSGQLRAYAISEQGREITLYRLLERDVCLFSAACMLKGIDFEISVAAEQDSELLILSPQVYARLCAESTLMAAFTNEVMAARFSDVMWLLEQILYKRFDARLAAFLLEESAFGAQPVLALTHEKIAQHLGSAREVVTRMLRYFSAEGLVELARGKVILHDIAALTTLAQGSMR